MINYIKNLMASGRAASAATLSLERRLAIQTRLVRGQNLQMMDFAELGRPSLRAHLALPLLAGFLPTNRAVLQLLNAGNAIGVVLAYGLTIVASIVAAALASEWTVT